MPSMVEAATIRNLVERHAYVFRNGLSDPGFFDLAGRRHSEEFAFIRGVVKAEESVLEIGCLTGLTLLALAHAGHQGRLHGIECVSEAAEWLRTAAEEFAYVIDVTTGFFPGPALGLFDVSLCVDVLEHQVNVGRFLDGVRHHLRHGGRAVVIVPKGKEYYDCGHAAFWPDAECLANTLGYFFEHVTITDGCCGRKLLAVAYV